MRTAAQTAGSSRNALKLAVARARIVGRRSQHLATAPKSRPSPGSSASGNQQHRQLRSCKKWVGPPTNTALPTTDHPTTDHRPRLFNNIASFVRARNVGQAFSPGPQAPDSPTNAAPPTSGHRPRATDHVLSTTSPASFLQKRGAGVQPAAGIQAASPAGAGLPTNALPTTDHRPRAPD